MVYFLLLNDILFINFYVILKILYNKNIIQKKFIKKKRLLRN